MVLKLPFEWHSCDVHTFLQFRDSDIGCFKSSVAGDAANRINPDFRIEALQNRVSPDTEEVFNDEFWANKDLIINALDNVNARLYVDSRCVYFGKPLLESGTLGTKCNTQNVIPQMTENYGATRDPPEKSAPMCTLHSFPHNIQHCLTYARSEFEGLFEKTPADANTFLENPHKYIEGGFLFLNFQNFQDVPATISVHENTHV